MLSMKSLLRLKKFLNVSKIMKIVPEAVCMINKEKIINKSIR